ncbi:MAG: nitroreductase family protein [Bacteroidales bacterium]|nr:nitroreductase family protein [Bacteroidales bacterium]MBO7371876.1 nitroreductase family protein [Bacteroidales bacterium]MBO7584465.1 nitroreductase family protein [Bacteroidales bacterium]
MKRIASFCALIAMCALTACSTGNNSAPSFDEVFASRRSIRAYEPGRTISEDQLKELFKATQNAPSWANFQPTKYYAAVSKESREAVLALIGGNKNSAVNASVLLISTFERGKSGYFQGQQTNEIGEGWGAHDNGLCNAYLILKARAMGFDTLIMGMRDGEGLRAQFNIPENETIMAVIALGYRAEEPRDPVHKSLDEFVKFF